VAGVTIVIFAHSLLSDWNHGNAHFLRGIVVELQCRGVSVEVYEPADAWSAANLVAEHGAHALAATYASYPTLKVTRYTHTTLDLDHALSNADVVLVHEWSSHELVRQIGQHHARSRRRYVLLFHDTHHRTVSRPVDMQAYDLSEYDGVLAFGEVVRRRYVDGGLAARAWTWHEAADTRVFRPLTGVTRDRDVVWIGNWGDEERTAELRAFLIEPAMHLGLRTTIYGVRYPKTALDLLASAGMTYEGWLPNYKAPAAFARHRVTVHVPRRPYVRALPGVPTIRPFEALACGIPLVSAPWDDEERLFRPGVDYLVARNGRQMARHLRDVVHDHQLAASLALHGRETVLARHTCAHRVDQLLAICNEVRPVATAGRSVCV
jgi:spore maturation protein CgeB